MKGKTYLAGLITAALMLWSTSAFAGPVPIDLSGWSTIQYEFNSQPDANWILSSGNTTATQTVNADASILLGDFNITNQRIEGSWQVNTSSDDDYMGFVFGYQSRGEYYLFDWKQSDQNDPLGFAERGMSLKVVNTTGGADPTASDMWPTAGSGDVSVLQHNTLAWQDFVSYDFRLDFAPGLFEIAVLEGTTVLEQWTIADSTFTSGQFGFYNYSQGNVVYNGFTQQEIPPKTIPEPMTVVLVGTGMLSVIARRKTQG